MPGKIKLLIVDDEERFLDTISKRLEIRDFIVTKATSGEQALDIVSREKFDIALLDLKMPGMDGRQVLKLLKQEHKFLEILILTGHGSLDSAVECTKLGAFGYLPKPYELENLLEVLQQAYEARLRKKFALDEERMEHLLELSTGSSPLGILREMRKLDDELK